MLTWKINLLVAFLCVGIASFFYKRAHKQEIREGSFLVVQGFFFLLTIISSILLLKVKIEYSPHVFLGIAAGIAGATGAFSSLKSLKTGELGANVAITRLSFIPVVIGAIILFGESITIKKTVIIIFAGVAVFLFFSHYKKTNSTAVSSMIPAAISTLAFGCFDLIYKYAMIKQADPYMFIAIQSITGNIIFNLYVSIFEKYKITKNILKNAPICGILFSTGCLAWLKVLSDVDVSLVAPFMQMNFILTYILGVMFLKESVTLRKVFGISIVLISIILMSDIWQGFLKII